MANLLNLTYNQSNTTPNNKVMKQVSVIAAFLLFPLLAFSQAKILFDYDESGNRIVRKPYNDMRQTSKSNSRSPNEEQLLINNDPFGLAISSTIKFLE